MNHNPLLEARSYTHSVPFDVHTWSDHPESNTFVDRVFADHVEGQWIPKGQASTPKHAKHYLKVLLLHLYVTWKRDPSLSVGVSMKRSNYKKGRLKEIHVSVHTPDLVRHLNALGVIGFRLGQWGGSKARGYQSIIWPGEPLIELFKQSILPEEAVVLPSETDLVRMKAEKPKRLVRFEENELTEASRAVLTGFNQLIENTQIHLNGSEPARAKKLCYRVFSRESFELGGRVTGGWWQNVESNLRDRLTINGNAVVELDYHAIHPTLLYAMVKLPLKHDPYRIEGADRATSKLLLLTAINAENEKVLFRAFRRRASRDTTKFEIRSEMAHHALDADMDPDDIDHLVGIMRSSEERADAFRKLKSKTNNELGATLESLKKLNEPIADYLCSDIGIRLQRTDSDICMKLIEEMTGRGIPVLPIHDSFIVEKKHEGELREVMERTALEMVGFPVRVDSKSG